MFDLQKANTWKRVSAWILDAIMLVIAITGGLYAMTSLLGYGQTLEEYNALQQQYIEEFGVDMSATELSAEEIALRETADAAFRKDADAIRLNGRIVAQTPLIIAFPPLIAFLLLEFLVPLIFGNGQTLGKKVFGVAVMREDGVRLTPLALFARTILGKYTLGLMLPALLLALFFIGTMGLVALVVAAALLIAQIVVPIASRTNAAVHDKLACTLTVDMASQMIFDTKEDLLAYKNRLQAEKAQAADY